MINNNEKPIYIIAGEASGDNLGEHIINAFPHSYVGVGGHKMEQTGKLEKLFDSFELSVMGIVEVLPHIFRLYRLMKKTTEHIIQAQPKALITIDAPDFNQRVVRMLRQHPAYQARPFPCIHVGAPTVWAWRPKRAEKVAKLWHQLWTLFPFEPPYFPGLPTHFIGHPLGDPTDELPSAREPRTCLLLPGSRIGEIKQHWPILRAVCERHPELSYVLLTLPHLIPVINEIGEPPAHCTLHTSYDMSRAHIALAASGTVSLELAKAKTPMITFYRTHPTTAWIVRKLIRTPYVNLVNILLNKEEIPELLQESATVERLCEELVRLHHNPQAWKKQQKALGEAVILLRGPNGSFQQTVAEHLNRL